AEAMRPGNRMRRTCAWYRPGAPGQALRLHTVHTHPASRLHRRMSSFPRGDLSLNDSLSQAVTPKQDVWAADDQDRGSGPCKPCEFWDVFPPADKCAWATTSRRRAAGPESATHSGRWADVRLLLLLMALRPRLSRSC